MRSDFALIAFAPDEWHEPWGGRQHIVSRLGARLPVVYANGAWYLNEIGNRDWLRSPRFGRFAQMDNVSVDDPPRWIMRWPRFGLWDAAAVAYLAARWRKALVATGAARRIAYLFHPHFLVYVPSLKADYLVYHVDEAIEQRLHRDAAQDEAERELLRRADLVIASSQTLADALAREVDRPIKVLPDAASASDRWEAQVSVLEAWLRGLVAADGARG